MPRRTRTTGGPRAKCPTALAPAEAGLLLFEEVAIEEDAVDGMLEALLVVVCIVGGTFAAQVMAAPSRRAGGTCVKELMEEMRTCCPYVPRQIPALA